MQLTYVTIGETWTQNIYVKFIFWIKAKTRHGDFSYTEDKL